MKISICIPQYNRIRYLLKNLSIVSEQTYDNIEVVIVDDCSTDNTVEEIKKLMGTYRYPIVFEVNPTNVGYDRNLRRSLELGSGDYLFTLGNDDTLNQPTDITNLVKFLESNDLPEFGYCNYTNFGDRNIRSNRAIRSGVIGSGKSIVSAYYPSFVFVGGLIFKRQIFHRFNTDRFDGSIYSQMYIGCRIVLSGYRLFTIEDHMVLTDIVLDDRRANTYRDWMTNDWKKLRKIDGGLPQTIHVITNAFFDSGLGTKNDNFAIVRKHYTQTYTFWLLEYRSNGGLVNAIGLVWGLFPFSIVLKYRFGFFYGLRIFLSYFFFTIVGLFTPLAIFKRFKTKIYNLIKRRTQS